MVFLSSQVITDDRFVNVKAACRFFLPKNDREHILTLFVGQDLQDVQTNTDLLRRHNELPCSQNLFLFLPCADMTAFIIISNETQSRNRLISMLSALANIEAMGLADSLAEAIEIVRKHYPNALIVDSDAMEEKGQDRLIPVSESTDSFIVIPSEWHIREKCIYIGIELPSAGQKGWVWNEIGKTLRECEIFAAQ